MRPLSVFLFGSPRIFLGGQLITHFGTKKVQALLAYLLIEHQTLHERGALAEMLWPDQPDRWWRRIWGMWRS